MLLFSGCFTFANLSKKTLNSSSLLSMLTLTWDASDPKRFPHLVSILCSLNKSPLSMFLTLQVIHAKPVKCPQEVILILFRFEMTKHSNQVSL